MRLEEHYGHVVVCGHIFAEQEIQAGQLWQGSSGHIVTMVDVDERGVVTYKWEEASGPKTWYKDSFAFQCRYCLITDAVAPDFTLGDVMPMAIVEMWR